MLAQGPMVLYREPPPPTCQYTVTLPVAIVLVCEPAPDSVEEVSGSVQSWHNVRHPPRVSAIIGVLEALAYCFQSIYRLHWGIMWSRRYNTRVGNYPHPAGPKSGPISSPKHRRT